MEKEPLAVSISVHAAQTPLPPQPWGDIDDISALLPTSLCEGLSERSQNLWRYHQKVGTGWLEL